MKEQKEELIHNSGSDNKQYFLKQNIQNAHGFRTGILSAGLWNNDGKLEAYD